MVTGAAGQGVEPILQWREYANAKINLGLGVLGLRPDGFHDIATLMQTIDLYDELVATPAEHPEFTCSDHNLPVGGGNLVVRAAKLYAEHVESVIPLCLHLVKRIPVGAGLGGGSADAAATLRLMNRIHGNVCSWRKLCDLAGQLGSDVPFLVRGGTAVATGRGEVLKPVHWAADCWYILVSPAVEVSTRWAYGQWSPFLTKPGIYVSFLDSVKSGGRIDHVKLFSCLENDFLRVVGCAYPIVAHLVSRLQAYGARVASMTGTGSTVFGIFDDRNAAAHALDALKEQGYRSFLCRAVPSQVAGNDVGVHARGEPEW